MINNLINNLLCNNCEKNNLVLKARFKKKRLTDGEIFCKNCKNLIYIRQGVIEFNSQIKSKIQTKYDEYWRFMPSKFERSENAKEIKIFNNYKEIFYKKKILDAGCGDGRTIPYLVKYNPKILVCVDFSNSIYITAKKYLNKYIDIPIIFIRLDLQKNFISKNFFDTTLSLGVVNFKVNQKKILKKLDYISKYAFILGIPSNKSNLGKLYQSLNIFRRNINNSGSNLLFFIFKMLFLNKLVAKLNFLNGVRNNVYSILEFLTSPEIIRKSNNFYAKILTKKNLTVKTTKLIDILIFKIN